jgi:glycosyltransferase involved in cell wall biosynthesis
MVSPSRTEGLSNVILEALTFGVPVVATRVGGNHEIMEHLVSGLLVEPGNPPRLAEGIRRVLTDSALKDEFVRAGKRRVLEAFSFEARMRREEALYDAALRRLENTLVSKHSMM